MKMTDDEILLTIHGRNSFEYNHTKAIEELNELATVLIKKLNKFGGPNEPDDQEVIDEIGDVEIRLKILRLMYDSGKVDRRVRDKLARFKDYIEANKYNHI